MGGLCCRRPAQELLALAAHRVGKPGICRAVRGGLHGCSSCTETWVGLTLTLRAKPTPHLLIFAPLTPQDATHPSAGPGAAGVFLPIIPAR